MRRHSARAALLSAWLALGAPLSADTSIPFAPAQLDAERGIVRFEPLVAIDWEKIARSRFRIFDIDHPDAGDLAWLRERNLNSPTNAHVRRKGPR